MSRSWKLRLRELTPVVATTLVALWYALLVLGVPLPMPRQAFSERFPCENCHCGCSSAKQCWQDCCCHSLDERIAWAEREGVTPPAFVAAQVAQRTQNTAPRSCCSKASSSCKKTPETALAACRSPEPRSCCASAKGAAPRVFDYVFGWRAMTCQGGGVQWTTVVPAIPTLVWTPLDTAVRVEWIADDPRPSVPGLSYGPVVPPPETAAV